MITSPPVRAQLPSSPAPGPVETAVGLVLARALPARPETWGVLRAHLLGVDGGPPVSAVEAASVVGESVSWLRGLLPRVRMVARHAGPPACVVTGVRLLEDGPVRTVEAARAALVAAGVSSGGVHPAGVLRVAEVVGVACSARVVDVGGVAVVAPAGRAALVASVRAAAVVAVRRVDAAGVAVVAAGAGVPDVVAAGVLEVEARWVVHVAADGASWCWRRGPARAQVGLVGATALRLLAVRSYDPVELRDAVVDAVCRLPPRTRGGLEAGVVPPAGVLAAWAGDTGLLLPDDDPARDDDPVHEGPGGPRRLRCAPEAGVRSDLVLAGAVAAAGGPLSTAALAVVLREAGYAPSSAVQLARFCPVLRRAGRDAYVLR